MIRIIVFSVLFLSITVICSGQSNQTESVTIRTYYPSPTGAYTAIRLKPSSVPTGRHGLLYFDNTLDMLRYYNKTNQWCNLTPGGGGPYWELNNATKVLKNINIGKVIIDGEDGWVLDNPPGALWLNGEMRIQNKNGNSTLYMGRSGSSYNASPSIRFFTNNTYGNCWDLGSEVGNPGSHNSTLVLGPTELGNPANLSVAMSVNEGGHVGIRFDKNESFWGASAPLHLVGLHDGSSDTESELFEMVGDGAVYLDIYSASNNTTMGPVLNFNRARGNLAARQRVQSGDNLFLLMPGGYQPGKWHRNSGSIFMESGGAFTATSSPTAIGFATTNTSDYADWKTRMVVHASGNVSLNNGWDEGSRFQVYNHPNTIYPDDPGGYIGYVNDDGDWISTSDRRLKKNISGIDDALAKVLRVQGIRYDPVTDTSSIEKKGKLFGFIGQDLEKVIPELVTTDSDGYKGVSYESITPVLVEAIKEQQKQIDFLRQEADALRARKKH